MNGVSSVATEVEAAVAAISEAEPLHLLQSCSTSRPHRGKVETNVAPDAEKVLLRSGDMTCQLMSPQLSRSAELGANQVRSPAQLLANSTELPVEAAKSVRITWARAPCD